MQYEKGWTSVEGGGRAMSQGAQGPPEAGKSKGLNSPLGSLGTQPADTSISAL